MATIIKRGSKFMALVRREGFKPVSKTFGKRSDATAWGKRTEADQAAGRLVAAMETGPTVCEALRQYRAAVVVSMKGAETYAYTFDDIAQSSLSAKPVSEITPVDLAVWRDGLQARGLAPGTVVRRLGLFGGFLSWCHKERGYIGSNPLHSVRKPRVSDARDRVMTDNERLYLLAAANTSRAVYLADVLTVALQSAMRRSEIFGLKRGDVDYSQSTAYLAVTKNDRARTVPLCPIALSALARLDVAAKEQGRDSLVPVGDAPAISLAFRRTVLRARSQYVKDCAASAVVPEASFLTNLRLHDLRHCAATMWAETGALSLPELMALTGHKTPRMLSRYISLSVPKLSNKLASISAGISSGVTA